MLGSDILNINRMRRLYQRYPQRLIAKVLHPNEVKDLQQAADPARFIAKRWAAKEAIAKAIGCGLRDPILMPTIGIAKTPLGAPYVYFSESAQRYVKSKGINNIAITISDEHDYVVAFALCCCKTSTSIDF